jgi:hypothetical protein
MGSSQVGMSSHVIRAQGKGNCEPRRQYMKTKFPEEVTARHDKLD